MASKTFSLVRGRVMRATALDGCGRQKSAACSWIVTDGFISVALTANTTQSDDITVTNAAGKTCVSDPGTTSLNGYGVEFQFCEVNPDLYAMLTNQQTVYDAQGNAVGFRVNANVNSADVGFALELWSTVPSVVCSTGGAQGSYGYFLLPFVSGGIVGDFTLENGAVTFTITGAQTKSGSGWGVGPYNVVRQSDGTPGALLEPIDGGDHLHVQYTDVAPPEPGQCQPSGSAASTATAGIPGTYGPANTYAPTDLIGLRASGITASPATAWTVGQYMVLGDKTHAYWDGNSWEPGEAPAILPTGATAGTPGSFTPTNSAPPQTLFALRTATPAITASPTTAWTTGQHVVLGDGQKVYWDGDSWEAR